MSPHSVLRRLSLLAVLMVAAACQSNPKQVVLNLDTTDPRWQSRKCVAHRKAAADYNDGERSRAVVGLANFAAPLVGTAASSLMSWRQDPARAELNTLIQRDCVSPARRTVVRNGRQAAYKVKPFAGRPTRR